MSEESKNEWEFDDRRIALCQYVLKDGEELVWYESDERFPGHKQVKKTLRKLDGGFTFMVESNDKILTVGTAFWYEL